MAYKKKLYDPKSKEPFKLSRTKIDLFIDCPRCFYLDRRLGIARPKGFPFNLNSAVDHLLKKEFDHYRQQQEPHPLMAEAGLDAIPFSHPNLDQWRQNFTGIQYHHPQTNFLLFGAIDDVWVFPDNQLAIVDYKATSKEGDITLEDPWKITYKRQMEIYQWLFRRNGFEVAETGYFVYANGLRSEPNFSDQLKFKTVLLPYKGNDAWVEEAVVKAWECLQEGEVPEGVEGCEFCLYRSIALDDNA